MYYHFFNKSLPEVVFYVTLAFIKGFASVSVIGLLKLGPISLSSKYNITTISGRGSNVFDHFFEGLMKNLRTTSKDGNDLTVILAIGQLL